MRTICCKLKASFEIEQALLKTSRRFAEGCNFVLQAALEEKITAALALHKLYYTQVRALFNLSANLAIRAIRRVAATFTKLKGKRKKPKEFKPKSIDYDARIFSYHNEIVSLTTVHGRLRSPLLLGAHQRKALASQTPTSATVIQKGKTWYIHIIIEKAEVPCSGKEVMGIDLGLTNIATTSTGLRIEGASRQTFKAIRAQVRASLQSKGTTGAKKLLKKLSGYESRRVKHENHVLSNHIVKEAQRHNCGTIRMEQLKNIRSNTKTWNKHLNRKVAGWSFYQLQQFVTYKAAAFGIAIQLVNPAYTSQTCHLCLKKGSRQGELFSCLTCGDQHADVNASHVIALGRAVCRPARISSAS